MDITTKPEAKTPTLCLTEVLSFAYETFSSNKVRFMLTALGMAAQFSDEEKIKASDYVIDNSGSLDETQKQVSAIFGQLKQQA